MVRTGIASLLLVAACTGTAPPDVDDGVTDEGAPDDGAPDDGEPDDGASDDGAPLVDPCADPVVVPEVRDLDLLAPDQLAVVAAAVPCVPAGRLRDVLESPRTYWYDRTSLVPGYQDSFGDNVVAPIGMRPNTIDSNLIDLAVPGGHAQLFSEPGVFHFPFGHPTGVASGQYVVNFWQPGEANGEVLPVVYWERDPNQYTHRTEWMFPVGTVFGEMMFITDGAALVPFEIRTRTRTLAGWDVDAFRPFPRAADLADAIETRREGASAALDAMLAQLGDDQLASYRVAATHYASAFPARTSGIDELPGLSGADADFMHGLMRTTPFVSARDVAWKTSGNVYAWAPAAAGEGTIVPPGYNGAAFEVSEESCDGCHRDAGRPFKDWYGNVLAYGELWGNDEIFTWHPFTESRFVDASGHVVNFNYDNRELRPDLRAAGLIAPYNRTVHGGDHYQRIVRGWTDFAY